jgi:hypothetical protein
MGSQEGGSKMNAKVRVLFGIVLVLAMLVGASGVVSAAVTGAIFTTDGTCAGVNVNHFAAKTDVYLDGGPHHGGNAGLPDGNYYVQVTDPSGADVLGKSLTAVVTVSGGEFVQCYQLWSILYSSSSGFTAIGYDDTTNPGGIYKVWVSQDPAFENSASKTDNFKVEGGGPPPTPTWLHVIKFYDANANGINDDGQLITGWKINISDDATYDRFTPVDIQLAPDTYMVSEYLPVEPNWMATKPFPLAPVEVVLAPGDDKTVEFGNLCLGPGGGLTKGFWGNKNGQALFGADDLAQMVALNLRNGNGTAFNPVSYAAFKSWLGSANAVNMAYMLSAQLAAMKLNVWNGFVNPNSLIYAPGAKGANFLGFISAGALISEANAELGLHGNTPAGSPYRDYQEALKNALDNANNNVNFVQPTPCAFTFPD